MSAINRKILYDKLMKEGKMAEADSILNPKNPIHMAMVEKPKEEIKETKSKGRK